MAVVVKGNPIPNALSYSLHKKVGDDYEFIANQQIGKIDLFEPGGIDSNGQPDESDRNRTSFIHVSQLVDDPSVHKCVNTGMFIPESTHPVVIFYCRNNYSSFRTYLTYDDLSDVGSTAEKIKEYARKQGANFVIFCFESQALSPWVNLTNDIFFNLDAYENALTAGQTHQLVVKAIGEGDTDIDGDGIIYEDSEYGGDENGNPLDYNHTQ